MKVLKKRFREIKCVFSNNVELEGKLKGGEGRQKNTQKDFLLGKKSFCVKSKLL